MISEENLVLNMPFDEAAGSLVAYDYSRSRADGVVTDAEFVAGKQGNCIKFNGNGKVEVEDSIINFAMPFSICAWLSLDEVSRIISIVINYNGLDKYYKYDVTLQAGTWYNLVLVRENNKIFIYLNGTCVQYDVLTADYGNPIGVSINQANYCTLLGNGCLDEVKIYQQALTQEDINEMLSSTKQLSYLIDGKDFKSFGVSVSNSKGLVGALKLKEIKKVDFSGYHGAAVDLSRPRFEEREITLECYIHSTGGKMAFVNAVQQFVSQFFSKHQAPASGMEGIVCPAGLHRLTVDIHPTKPLIYEVYLPDGTDVEKTWNDSTMTGTFTLKLREAEPVKMVLKHMRIDDSSKRATITLTTNKLVNIYWGDGTTTQDVYGSSTTITHNFAENGDYFIVITGVIEEITSITTNAIIVWEKL